MKGRVRLLLIVFICLSIMSLSGCETVRRKFVRKAKTEKENPEEVIYVPQEYPVQVTSNEDMYRNYYTFWKSWHQELIEVLSEGQNHKKQVECINEVIGNLNKMKDLLVPDAQGGLNEYIQKVIPIQGEIVSNRSNPGNLAIMKAKLESIKSKIARDYIIKKIKQKIIK